MSLRDRLHFLWSQRRRQRAWEELSDELKLHIELETERLISQGLSPVQARKEARRRFGPLERVREESIRESGFVKLDRFLLDLRYAFRTLIRNPMFAVVAIATLALCTGMATAIFSVVDGVLFKPFPYNYSEQLVMITSAQRERGWHGFPLPAGAYFQFKEKSESLQKLAAFRQNSYTLTGGVDPERISGARLTPELFDVLGIHAHLGRLFVTDDYKTPDPKAVVISYGLWQRLFGASRDALGRDLHLDGDTLTVVGVLPAGFWFPSPQEELWVPMSVRRDANLWENWALSVIGRIAEEEPAVAVQEEIDYLTSQFASELPFGGTWRFEVQKATDAFVEEVRSPLLLLLGAVALVLCIGCFNVAGLCMARTLERDQELSVRRALGCGRWGLIRQLLVEHSLLGLAGGVGGLLIAYGAIRIFVFFDPVDLPRSGNIEMDWRTLFFALGVALASGLLLGLFPVLQTDRDSIAARLRGGRRVSAEPVIVRSRGLLLFAQVALTSMLLTGAVLLSSSFLRVSGVHSGFEGDDVLTARVTLPRSRYSEESAWLAFFDQLLEGLQRYPSIETVGATTAIPTRGVNMIDTGITIDGQNPVEGIDIAVDVVTPGYFQSLGIPLKGGRLFHSSDRQGNPPVVIINESVARRFLAGTDPIGRRILGSDDSTWLTVVGVVGDVKQYGLDEETPFHLFVPLQQVPRSNLYLTLRMAEPGAGTSIIREEVRKLDPDQPVTDINWMEDLLRRSLMPRTLPAVLVGAFAALALLIVVIGIYGMLANGVQRRTREIGVRLALGASRRQVLGLVMQSGLRWTLAGLAAGTLGAYALSVYLENLLFQVQPRDLALHGLVGIVVLILSLLACYLPSRKAVQIDPVEALRYE